MNQNKPPRPAPGSRDGLPVTDAPHYPIVDPGHPIPQIYSDGIIRIDILRGVARIMLGSFRAKATLAPGEEAFEIVPVGIVMMDLGVTEDTRAKLQHLLTHVHQAQVKNADMIKG